MVQLRNEYSSSPSSGPSSDAMASTSLSWSSMYGRSGPKYSSSVNNHKPRTYKSNYGRVTTLDALSTRFKNATPDIASSMSRYKDSSSSRSRVTASVDRDLEHHVTLSDKYFDRSFLGYPPRLIDSSDISVSPSVSPRLHPRSMSVGRDASSYSASSRYSVERDCPTMLKTNFSRPTSSLSRSRFDRSTLHNKTFDRGVRLSRNKYRYDEDEDEYDSYTHVIGGATVSHRAASVSRYTGSKYAADEDFYLPSPKPRRAASVSRYEGQNTDWSLSRTPSSGHTYQMAEINVNDVGTRGDISRFVVEPGTKFEPTDVRLITLPSGKQAVALSKFSQRGRGDPMEANDALNKVVEKTMYMQESITSLEEFVRRNRSLFPEDTTIYQQMRFFQLNEAQLLEIGEQPGAEVYGVKIIEKLVVPPGTDVSDLMNRYYRRRGDIEVEIEERSSGSTRGRAARPRATQIETSEEEDYESIQRRMRVKVENDFDKREKQHILNPESSYERQEADRFIGRRDRNQHIHPHLTQDYIRSFYVNAGLRYDDIYRQPRSRPSSITASSVTSDHESQISSSSASRRKRFDTAPALTARYNLVIRLISLKLII